MLLKLSRFSAAVALCSIVAAATHAASANPKKLEGGATAIPTGLRKEAAFHILTSYRREGTGKPEISAAPRLVSESAPAFRLLVRYPAKDGTRCLTVQSGPADEEGNFRFSVQTHSGSEVCSGEEKFIRYQELDQMMARVRTCEQKGEARCVVSDPGSSNRKIIVLR